METNNPTCCATFLACPGCVELMQATGGPLDHLGVAHNENVVHIQQSCTTRRSKVGMSEEEWRATLASLHIWWTCMPRAFLNHCHFVINRLAATTCVWVEEICSSQYGHMHSTSFLATVSWRFQAATPPGGHSLSFGFLSDPKK